MRIRRLQLHDFRRYRDLEIDLAPGLTVVRGPNEAGKSTIQRAIELALTRRVTSAAADMGALRPWDAGEDVPAVIVVDFERGHGRDAPSPGRSRRRSPGAKGTVLLDYDGQSITDPALADQVLAELTGIPTEAFFRSTASVRHHELADLARDEAALHDRLQASISGADRGTSQAKKKLEKALHELNTKGDKNPGRLKVAETAVAQAQAAVEQGDAQLAQLAQDRDTLNGALARRADAETALVERRALLEKARQAERLIAERDAAQRALRAVSPGRRGQRGARPALDDPSVAQPAAGPPRRRRAPAHPRHAGARAARGPGRRGQRQLRGRAGARPGSRIATWSIPLIVVRPDPRHRAARAERRRGRRPRDHPVGRGRDHRRRSAASSPSSPYRLRQGGSIDDRAARRRDRPAPARPVRDGGRALPGRAGDRAAARHVRARRTWPTAEDLLAREEAHVAQIDRLTAQLDGLVGKEPPETLAATRDAAALEVAQKTSALEHLGPIAKEPRARERLEVEVRDQESALEHARDDEANARARVEANPVDAEQVAGQAERLAVLARTAGRAPAARPRLRDDPAVDRGGRAGHDEVRHALPRAAHGHATSTIATGGPLPHVRVDDKTLDIEVRAPEKRDWVKVTSLSQGTLDLVYLTARLGLVRLVTGDRRPPLVFDDPFVTLDDARATRALELLRGVATDFQVIYLTTSDRYDAVAPMRSSSCPDRPPSTTRRPPADRRARRRGRAPDRSRTRRIATVVLGSRLGAVLGRRRLRRRPHESPGAGLRGGPHLAADRDGDRRRRSRSPRGETVPRPADLGWSVLAGIARRRRDHGPVPRPRGRTDGDRRAGHGRARGGHPGRRRGRPRGAAGHRWCSRDRGWPSSPSCSSRASRTRAAGAAASGWRCSPARRIGLFGIAIAQISDGHVFGPLTIVRAVAVRPDRRGRARDPLGLATRRVRSCRAIIAIGVADMAGNAFYILAVQAGALAVASVVSSLYPVDDRRSWPRSFLHERVTRSHAVGHRPRRDRHRAHRPRQRLDFGHGYHRAIRWRTGGCDRAGGIEQVWLVEATYAPDAAETRVPVPAGAPRRASQRRIAAGVYVEVGRVRSTSRRPCSSSGRRARRRRSRSSATTSTCATASGWSSAREPSAGWSRPGVERP